MAACWSVENMDSSLYLWDVTTGRRLRHLTGGHSFAASQVAFSPNGATLARVSLDRVFVWDVASGREAQA